MREGGLAGNSEELAPEPEGRYSKKRFGLTAMGDGKRKIPNTKTYKEKMTSTAAFVVVSLRAETARVNLRWRNLRGGLLVCN
jgi:hypothetical protein